MTPAALARSRRASCPPRPGATTRAHVEDGRENAGAGNTITGGILTSDFPHVPHWQIQQAVIEALMRLDADGADNGN